MMLGMGGLPAEVPVGPIGPGGAGVRLTFVSIDWADAHLVGLLRAMRREHPLTPPLLPRGCARFRVD